MKKLSPLAVLLAAAVLLGLASSSQAGPARTLLWQYNLNSTTEIFCGLGPEFDGSNRVTASASTTVTAVSGSPFANVQVGARILITDSNGTSYERAVTVRNSATSIVISGTGVTITSGVFKAQNVTCSTSNNDAGAFAVDEFSSFTVGISISQQVTTGGIQFRLQCRVAGGGPWVQQYPALTPPAVGPTYSPAYTSTGQFTLGSQDAFGECRVGMLIVTNDDGNDLTTNAEQVTIIVAGRTEQ